MSRLALLLASSFVGLTATTVACSDSPTATTPDATTTTDATTTPDATTPDATTPDATTSDATTPDATTPDATTSDATTTADATDTATGSPIAAVSGARCALDERVALIEIAANEWSSALSISGRVDDRPNPWYGEPALTTATCGYWHFVPTGACAPCGEGEVCGVDGQCTAAAVGRTDASLVLTTDGAPVTLAADATTGDLYGDVTSTDRVFSAELSVGGVVVTVAATPLPPALADLAGTLAGSYDAPTGLDLTWTAPVAGDAGLVFTHIPVNHHAAGPTFTECAVDAASGAMHVDGDMLTPLAVVTGLEFQGIEHLRVAAAETSLGCVEFRVTTKQYVGLF